MVLAAVALGHVGVDRRGCWPAVDGTDCVGAGHAFSVPIVPLCWCGVHTRMSMVPLSCLTSHSAQTYCCESLAPAVLQHNGLQEQSCCGRHGEAKMSGIVLGSGCGIHLVCMHVAEQVLDKIVAYPHHYGNWLTAIQHQCSSIGMPSFTCTITTQTVISDVRQCGPRMYHCAQH